MNPLSPLSTSGALVGWGLMIVLFFLARYFLCWFFKINVMIALLRSIDKGVKLANGELPVEQPSQINKILDTVLPPHAASRVRAALDAVQRKK